MYSHGRAHASATAATARLAAEESGRGSYPHHVELMWHQLGALLLTILELYHELLVEFRLIVDVFFSTVVLLSSKRRRVFEVDAAVLTEKVWHYFEFNYY